MTHDEASIRKALDAEIKRLDAAIADMLPLTKRRDALVDIRDTGIISVTAIGLVMELLNGAPPAQEEVPRTPKKRQNEPDSKAWREGLRAAQAGRDVHANPYTPKTVAFDGWLLGFESFQSAGVVPAAASGGNGPGVPRQAVSPHADLPGSLSQSAGSDAPAEAPQADEIDPPVDPSAGNPSAMTADQPAGRTPEIQAPPASPSDEEPRYLRNGDVWELLQPGEPAGDDAMIRPLSALQQLTKHMSAKDGGIYAGEAGLPEEACPWPYKSIPAANWHNWRKTAMAGDAK